MASGTAFTASRSVHSGRELKEAMKEIDRLAPRWGRNTGFVVRAGIGSAGALLPLAGLGMALIAAYEADTDLPFPRLRAADFAALMVLDELVRTCGAGSVVTADELAAAATAVRERHSKAMTNDLRVGNAVESTARDLLGALDLLRPTGAPDEWRLTAAAARYRDPRVVAVNARLDEEGEG